MKPTIICIKTISVVSNVEHDKMKGRKDVGI